jgi:DNA-binding PadR family transcriptional regulator
MARRQSDVAWSDPALLILGRLASGLKHGHGIFQDTESTVGITLGPGTLYAALSRPEEPEHVRALPGEDRRPYEITAAGISRLQRAALAAYPPWFRSRYGD